MLIISTCTLSKFGDERCLKKFAFNGTKHVMVFLLKNKSKTTKTAAQNEDYLHYI